MDDNGAGILRAQICGCGSCSTQICQMRSDVASVYISACQLENMANIRSFQTPDSFLKHFDMQSRNECCIWNIVEYVWLGSCNFMIEGIKNWFFWKSQISFGFPAWDGAEGGGQTSGAALPPSEDLPAAAFRRIGTNFLIHLWVLVLTLE